MSDVMAISRLRMGTDGEGITTLVGFYGCPLSCRYCANNYCHQSSTVRANYTPEELLQVLSIDEPYFLMTGGGVTFGGGEPLLQAEFIHEVCQKMNPKWKRTIETSLYAPWKRIKMLVQDIDYWYVDIKDINNDIYEAYTGKDNEIMLENLIKLASVVPLEKICIRVPLIPKFNTVESRNKEIEWLQFVISKDVRIDAFKYIPMPEWDDEGGIFSF